MPEITLTPGELPQPQCYADEQARFEAYVAAIITSLTGGLQWTASTTAPTDLTQYWLKTDTSNPGDPSYARGLELLKWSVPDAAWVRVFSIPSSTGVTGGPANSFTLTHSPPYITAASAYRIGQVYVFVANNDITGAATLNVDGLGAKAIKKRVNLDLIADDILNGQMVSVIYDGTNFQMLSDVSNYDLSYFPPGELGQVFRTIGPYPGVSAAWDSPVFETAKQAFPTVAGVVTIPHSLGRVPYGLPVWVAVCKTDNNGYVAGDEVDLRSFSTIESTNFYPVAWVFTSNATNLYLTTTDSRVSNGIFIANRTTGAYAAVTPGEWEVKAYYT